MRQFQQPVCSVDMHLVFACWWVQWTTWRDASLTNRSLHSRLLTFFLYSWKRNLTIDRVQYYDIKKRNARESIRAESVTCFEYQSVKDKSFSRVLSPRVIRVVHRPQHSDSVTLEQLSSVSAANGTSKTTQQLPRLPAHHVTHQTASSRAELTVVHAPC